MKHKCVQIFPVKLQKNAMLIKTTPSVPLSK